MITVSLLTYFIWLGFSENAWKNPLYWQDSHMLWVTLVVFPGWLLTIPLDWYLWSRIRRNSGWAYMLLCLIIYAIIAAVVISIPANAATC